MNIPNTPITRKQWENARPGIHILLDVRGRQWRILSKPEDDPDGPRLEVQCPGGDSKNLILSGALGGRHIVDHEDSVMLEFHAPGATVTFDIDS